MNTNRTDRLEELLIPFHGDGELGTEAYELLFQYFVEGWARHRTPGGERIAYPGWPSWSGALTDGLEGFARLWPLMGAWIHGGRSGEVTLLDGSTINLRDAFFRGLLAGTDVSSREYWGELKDQDQRIVEAADIALTLWLLRDAFQSSLSGEEKVRVVRWLAQADRREGHDNNWHLFIVLIDLVLEDLGYPVADASAKAHYRRVKEFYRGDGWFSDGMRGSFDYYNAWGFHYALYWIEQIRPDMDPQFITEARGHFLCNYKYLLSPAGTPILGRSVCYRMALAAPLVFGHGSCPEQATPAEARRALDCTWRYFIRRGALQGGNVTQGYFGPDRRIVENYSGPASCLWSLRSLIPAFYIPDDSDFWALPAGKLPVEKESYRIHVGATGWTIRGDAATQDISVEMPQKSVCHRSSLKRYGVANRLLELIYGTPQRPDNYGAKYGRKTYRAIKPFCE